MEYSWESEKTPLMQESGMVVEGIGYVQYFSYALGYAWLSYVSAEPWIDGRRIFIPIFVSHFAILIPFLHLVAQRLAWA